jgi:hypothetical protein
LPQTVEVVPDGLAEAIGKKYQRKAVLERSEVVDYRNELRPLWNGTVYTFKLSGQSWPKQVFVFRMGENWKEFGKGVPRTPTALDAVKIALREKWSKEIELGFNYR